LYFLLERGDLLEQGLGLQFPVGLRLISVLVAAAVAPSDQFVGHRFV